MFRKELENLDVVWTRGPKVTAEDAVQVFGHVGSHCQVSKKEE